MPDSLLLCPPLQRNNTRVTPSPANPIDPPLILTPFQKILDLPLSTTICENVYFCAQTKSKQKFEQNQYMTIVISSESTA